MGPPLLVTAHRPKRFPRGGAGICRSRRTLGASFLSAIFFSFISFLLRAACFCLRVLYFIFNFFCSLFPPSSRVSDEAWLKISSARGSCAGGPGGSERGRNLENWGSSLSKPSRLGYLSQADLRKTCLALTSHVLVVPFIQYERSRWFESRTPRPHSDSGMHYNPRLPCCGFEERRVKINPETRL